jgi:simple sugar transport system permease protein
MALGFTFVIITGEIDLSFPGVMALSSFLFANVLTNTGSPIPAVLVCLISGIALGFINGVIVTKTKIPSIIVTLGTQFASMGTALILSDAGPLHLGDIKGSLIFNTFVGRLGGIFPVQSLWAFGLAILAALFLNRHRFGEAVMFSGDNREAARMLGINTDKVIIQVFILMGLMTAFAGMLLTLHMSAWWPTYGLGYLLIVIAAVFIGGTSLYGGEGTIFGTVVGAFVMGSMTAGIVAAGVQEYWVKFAQGAVLLGAVFLQRFLIRKRPA